MQKIFFRVDGNEEIATGHIMRCLSIARACVSFGAKVCFLVSDETSQTLLQERFLQETEFETQCLHSNYRFPETELPLLQKIFAKENNRANTWLFIDSYFVTKHYLSEIRKLCKTAYLDDILAFDYPVDLVINYDVTTEPSCYHQASWKLLGASYTPLREQFVKVPYTIRTNAENILLSTGGTDTYNVAGALLARSSELPSCHYHVLTSRLNTHYAELKQLSSQNPFIHIHENVQDMAALMSQCDLAVSAGGTTLYELCAVGVPAISFAMADNQEIAVATFAKQGIIPYAGDVRTSFTQVIDTLLLFLQQQSHSSELRKKSSQTMRAFIDGEGALRIARVLTDR